MQIYDQFESIRVFAPTYTLHKNSYKKPFFIVFQTHFQEIVVFVCVIV